MGLGQWLNSFFFGDEEAGIDKVEIDTKTRELLVRESYKYLAVNSCINFIASVISLANFQTYDGGELVRSNESYRFNVEPNQNTSSTAFWRRVVEKMVSDNECLIVKITNGGNVGEYHVAESYTRTEYAMRPNEYTDVWIGRENPYRLNDTFYEKDVFFLQWNNLGLQTYIAGVYNDLSQLISAAKDNYLKLSATKVLIQQDASTNATAEFNAALQNLVNNYMKDFMDPSKSVALPLRKGMNFQDVSRTSSATSTNAATEIKTLVQEGISLTAMAFQISPQLLIGDIAGIDDAWRLTMTQCIKPIVNIISDEINRKLYGRANYLKGRRMFIDISNVSYTDLKDVANALEVLTRIGVNTLDDNLRVLGREPVGGEFGTMRCITKNYVGIDWLKSDEAKGVKTNESTKEPEQSVPDEVPPEGGGDGD